MPEDHPISFERSTPGEGEAEGVLSRSTEVVHIRYTVRASVDPLFVMLSVQESLAQILNPESQVYCYWKTENMHRIAVCARTMHPSGHAESLPAL